MKLDSYKNKSQIKMKTNYVMYCRKSSESEDRQMASIPSQIAVLKELTAEKGIHAFKKFSESRSAKAPGRSEFDRMNRKSTRLNSSHQIISYAVFCLKKKKRI